MIGMRSLDNLEHHPAEMALSAIKQSILEAVSSSFEPCSTRWPRS